MLTAASQVLWGKSWS